MEDVIQRIFAILISVMVFFLLPMYIAFEKKDDISYTLALQITEDFVNNVTNKGYLTQDMYDNFVSNLSLTNNIYTISLEHIAKKYYPVYVNYNDNKEYMGTFDYAMFNKIHNNYNDLRNSNKYKNLKLGYRMEEERYYTDQILDELSNENIFSNEDYNSKNIEDIPLRPNLYDSEMYAMNEGDQFNVIIKNENTTVASIIFNALTFGGNAENNIKVYIDYGGTIKNVDYRNY